MHECIVHLIDSSVNFTEEEDQEIKDGAVTYLTDISKILAKIPREMLLILKTNDQLRGLEVRHQLANPGIVF